MADYYTWIKAVHLISMVVVVGGMLLNGFLFRNVAPTSPDAARTYAAALAFNRYFVGSALALVWIAGLTLMWLLGAHKDGWFITKFVIVFILSGIHGAQTGRLAKLSRSPGETPSGLMVNSGPITLVLVALAICLVAIKPF
ncbi:MAG: CopD family protein [Rhizobium sp.]|nr:CopD family protein [Rhizobium sp.]